MNCRLRDISANFPDFLITGTAKAGTTSLYEYLRFHPNVFLTHPIKELWFWNMLNNPNRHIYERTNFLPQNLLSYCGMFDAASENQICGDITPSYSLFYEDTIRNLKIHHPNWSDVKIVMIFREPLSKMVSQYKHAVRLETENLTFEESLKSEKQRVEQHQPGWVFYRTSTDYVSQSEAFLNEFKHFKALLFDDLVKDPKKVMEDLLCFLDLDSSEFDFNRKYHAYNSARKKYIPPSFYQKILWKITKSKKEKQKFKHINRLYNSPNLISTSAREEINDFCMEQTLGLERLFGFDLSAWKRKYSSY